MKKINFHTIKNDDLEKQHGWAIVPAPEGVLGVSSFDNNNFSEDVVRFDSATMTWSRGGNSGHYCNSLNESEEIADDNDN
jgi:hypothetical protein